MVILTDESVTGSAVSYLQSLSNIQVVRSIDALGQGASDDAVAAYADNIKAVLVNSNAKDFAKLIARRPPTGRQQLRFAGRVSMCCKPSRESQRLQHLMPRLLTEFKHSKQEGDGRLIVDIHDDFFRVER